MNGDLDLQQQLTLFTIQCILFSSPNPSFISFSSNEAHVQKFDSFAYCAPRLEFLLLSSCNFVSRFLILRVLRISNRFPILVLCLPNSRFFLLMQIVKKQYSVGLAKGAKLVFQIECQLARHCLVSSQVMRVSFVALNCRVRRK